jgi:hypothetical protein
MGLIDFAVKAMKFLVIAFKLILRNKETILRPLFAI